MKKTSNNLYNKFAIIVCSMLLVYTTFIVTFLVLMGFTLINNNMEKHNTDNYEECYYMDIDESEVLELTRSDNTMFE